MRPLIFRRAVALPPGIVELANAMIYKRAALMGWAALALGVAASTGIALAQDDAEYARKAVELAKRKDYNGAAEQFSRAIKASPRTAKHYSNRGKAYRAAGKLAEAETDFTKVLELDSDNADALSERGKVRVSQKKFDEGIADLSKAMELDENQVDAQRFRAFAYVSKNDFDKAIEDYSAIIEKLPKDAEAHRRRGYAYTSKGDKEKAREDFQAVLKLKPADSDAAARMKALDSKHPAAGASSSPKPLPKSSPGT